MESKFASSLDTNLILRLILNDVPEQRARFVSLLSDDRQIFYVCDLVLAEVIFNLQKMGRTRTEIVVSLKMFLSIDNIHPESPFIETVLDFYLDHPALSFVDCYSACKAEFTNKEPLLTFDKKLSKQHPSAKLLA